MTALQSTSSAGTVKERLSDFIFFFFWDVFPTAVPVNWSVEIGLRCLSRVNWMPSLLPADGDHLMAQTGGRSMGQRGPNVILIL